jgi:hypothetical protein
MGPSALSCLVVIPDHANIMSSEGWTKQKVKDFIVKNAPQSLPGSRLSNDDFIVVVAGGPGAWMGLHRSAGGVWLNSFDTRKIELRGNWDKLVEKYREVVPNYE